MKPTLVVLAAGMGSRYGGVKQIDSVGLNNECLLDFTTYDAMESGFDKFVYIIRKDIEKDFRDKFFDRIAKNINAEYVFQEKTSLLTDEQIRISKEREKPWGTAHAILCAEKVVHSPFAVINSDDFYGRKAFQILGNYLTNIDSMSSEHAMVGYTLSNTMSKNGSVSRGICTVENERLNSIVENTKIYYDNDNIITEINDKKEILTGKEWVSMNLFGFSLKAFEEFNTYWEEFLINNLTSKKSEAFLPKVVDNIIKREHGCVRFFNSSESWFGMTYPEDREIVQSEIACKIENGYYPMRLWK